MDENALEYHKVSERDSMFKKLQLP